MAPGVRSARTGQHRADAGGEGGCWRGRWRAGAAGLPAHRLLAMGLLSLLVRCALAAEEKSTFDASGSSSLPSDPAATAAPADLLTDLLVAEEVPFSAAHSDGDSESEGGGLSGQPAFSSVLTVMAGTVKHPARLDQSGTLPSVTRDETHTTQWPSQSSSHGSEMSSSSSSSSSYAGDRSPPASSGLTPSISHHQHVTPLQPVTMLSPDSTPSHVFFTGGKRTVSSFSSSPLSLSSLLSSPAPSSSSVLSSPYSLSSSTGWMNKAASSQGRRTVSGPAPQTGSVTVSQARPLIQTDSLTTAQSTAHPAADLQAARGHQSTTTKSLHFSSETTIEKSNEITKNPLSSTLAEILGVTETSLQSTAPKVTKAPTPSAYTTYSTPNHGQNSLKIVYDSDLMQSPGTNSASNLEISTSFSSNEGSQAVPNHQGGPEDPTPALLPAPSNGHSVSAAVTAQVLNGTYEEQKDRVDSQTSGRRKRAGHAVTSPVGSHGVNPTVSSTGSFLTIPSETPPGKKSLPETAMTNLSPIYSAMVSSEHAPNGGDLLMAAGTSSPTAPAVNINYNRAAIAGAELKSISTQAQENNSLLLTQPSSESTEWLTREETTSSKLESGSFTLQSNDITNLQQFPTQKHTHQEQTGFTRPTRIFSSSTQAVSRSGSVLPIRAAKYITHKTMYDDFSLTIRPKYSLPLFLSSSPNHNTDDAPSVSSGYNIANRPQISLFSKMSYSERPLLTRPLLNFPHKLHTPSGPTLSLDKSQQTVSSGEIFAYNKKSKGDGHSKLLTFGVQANAGNNKSSPTSYGETSAESPRRNTAESSRSPLPDGTEELGGEDEVITLGQVTTQFPSLMATSDVFTSTRGSDSSGEGSSSESSSSPLTFDAPIEHFISLSGKDDVTFPYDGSSSSRSDIMSTQRTKSFSGALGPTNIVSGNKSEFHFGRQMAVLSTASSAATTSFTDGQNSIETWSSIFSFGTKLMAPYTKWKATKPVPFQSNAFDSETASSGFDRANSISPADVPSYEHPSLEDRQEPNILHILNSADPTFISSDPNSVYPSGYPPFTYVKGTAASKNQNINLSPAHLRVDLAMSVEQASTANTGAHSLRGPDTSLPPPHITTDSVSSPQDTLLAFVNESNPLLADDTTVRPQDTPANNYTDSDSVSAAYLKPMELTSQKELMLATPSTLSSSSSSAAAAAASGTSSLSLSSNEASQVSSNKNHIVLMSSKASSLMSPSSVSSTVGSADTTSSTKPPVFPNFASPPSSFPTISSDSDPVQHMTDISVVLTEAGRHELNAGTSRAGAFTVLKDKEASQSPSQSARITLSAGPTERTSQVLPLTPRLDTTTASVKPTTATVASATKTSPTAVMPSLSVTTATTQQPIPVTRRIATTTTVRTQTSRKTFTPLVLRTSPPRGATTTFISPFTTTTEAPPQQCNITERMWVRTVVSIYVRRNRLDSIQRQNLRRGLSQGLRKALNDTSAQAQVETVFGSPNMTVAYHVTGGDVVYPPSVVLEALDAYGRDKLIADLRQYLPMVTALPIPAALWRTSPASGFQLKTVLQFVGADDNPRSCRFSQMMEQRLERVFSEAQAKVLSTNSRLSVQMLSVTQTAGSPAVSLVYTVSNGTVSLNGTTASNLLGQLSAELVGYFLFYPPLIIAEPLEYHNLNTSIATRDFWVITVIQDVDNASLEGQYQSFASLMEQRLAELFVLAGQQGTRFRRATTVGSYTVQMVGIRRVSGGKNPAEMTYYVQHNGVPLPGTSAAKVLNTVDSQTMALTLGYFVQLQAEPVVKNPANNLWIIAAVLAPISVVTLIIIIITAVLCRKNKNDFKADAIGNLNPRAKMAYRRDVGYYHQPVQGFDYAKQHLGQLGGDEETLPASQDTLVMSLHIRDAPLSLEKALQQDGTTNKKSLGSEKHKSKLPSEDGSVISNESEKLNSGGGLTVAKVTAQQKLTKEETRKRDDPYDTSSGSLQLISIKPAVAQPNYSHPASSDRSQDSAIVNGEVNLALKQKSDIEHYRNKLRLKAKRKGYYDFPSTDGSGSSRALTQRGQRGHERAAGEHGRPLEPDDERGSTYVKSHRRHSQVGQTAYRSRQSLSSPSPGGTEMDLLVMKERPRRGIRNSGYDTEPELIEETNVDRLVGQRGYMYGRGLKGHSETSTLSSQPSIDEVRQQMHLLLEEAFSLASGGQSTSGRHHQHHPSPDHYHPASPPLPYADMVTSGPGTMSCGRGGLQWVPSYGADMYQCSLPKPAFRFTQLPEMAMDSPPPLPPRTGPPLGTALRRSTSDLGPKGRSSETSVTELQSQHDNNPYGLTTRAALPSITADQTLSNYSGNPITAVYAIPASRAGYSEYFLSTPPTSYHSPSWMSYPPEPEDVPPQWADSVPLPGYVEAFPHPRYPQGSPTRLPIEYNQAVGQPPVAPSTASQQSLPQVVKDMDSMPLSSLSTSALVQAIRQEVAKLAKKQNEMFEY